jgi:hypothetical protein
MFPRNWEPRRHGDTEDVVRNSQYHPLPRAVLTVVFIHSILCVSVLPRSQFRGNIEDTENVYQETSIEEVAEFFKILLTPLKIFLRVSK